MKHVALLATIALFTVPAHSQTTVPSANAPYSTVAPAPPVSRPHGMMRYDANKDGSIDQAEWTAFQEARFKRLDKNSDGKLSRTELAPRGATDKTDATFRRMDTNNDGSVSRAEFMAVAARQFAHCDANKDGKITPTECRQASKRSKVDNAAETPMVDEDDTDR